jgi:hypothetical protein
MSKLIMIIFLIIGIFLILNVYLFKKNHKYREVFKVTNANDLRKHFIMDNPNGDGTDPTMSMVDYAYMFPRDSNKAIIPNVNGDTTWAEIPQNPVLIKDDTNGGIIIKLADKVENGVVGAPRLMSRKLYRGGLFIFDIEHCPIGCGVWPAIWLNGFVGGKDQYHEKKGTDLYKEGMKKLASSTISKEGFDHTCSGPEESLLGDKPDPNLTEYMGKNIYLATWPSGGEFDIFEQTNFSDTNLVSIHSGPLCEVTNGYDNNYMIQNLDPEYSKSGTRSACGATYWPGQSLDPTVPASYGLGPYSGCKNDANKVGEVGGDSTKLPNGASRYNCPNIAAVNAGNTQIIAPNGSFGEVFNQNGGGVYALQWTPKDRVNVWWWPNSLYSRKKLKSSGGPLSKHPNPNKWPEKMKPNVANSNTKAEQKILIASYILNNKNSLSAGCDFNYQGIIINIALGGGWGGSSMPQYCSVNGKSEWRDYITKCFNASPENAIKQGKGVDSVTGCFDGGMSSEFRGKHADPVFYSEAYFKIREIKVLQSKTDDNIW